MEVEIYTEVNGKKYRLVRSCECNGCAFADLEDMCPHVGGEGVCDMFSHDMKWEEVKE